MKERKSSPSLMDARIDVASMFSVAQHTSDDVMVDDGTVTVTAFLVHDFRRVRVEDNAISEFDSGDSNAVCRKVWKNKDCALIHFWQRRAVSAQQGRLCRAVQGDPLR